MYAKVIIDIANVAVDRLFTYAVPESVDVAVGQRVEVPFGAGNKLKEGFVLDVTEQLDDSSVEYKYIRRTLEPYCALTRDQIELAYWIKASYHCLLVDALRILIPAQLRGGRVKEKTVFTVTLADGLTKEDALAGLTNKNGASRAPVQSEVVELVASVNKPVGISDITAFIPGSAGAVKKLIEKGILVREGFVTFRNPLKNVGKEASEPLQLTAGQYEAYANICQMIKNRGGTCLLHGVTGSGKTEVYMQAIAYAVEQGGRAIVLVPEISLTPQAMERFKSRFGDRIAVLHSRLSPGERYDEWRRIRLGKVDVVIGARSAIFAPLENIRLIIVDEEHEPSYYSEITPRYGAVEVAQKRAALCGAVLVLGSATPSITAYRKAKSGQYTLLELPERVNGHPLPTVDIVDMRREFMAGNNGIFSMRLYDELKRCLDAGEQAILFMNRRGYSTFVSCRGCGYVMKCDSCDVAMTYHKHIGGRGGDMLKCHYCGNTKRIPDVCPQCGKPYLKYFGVGTQQVEEQLIKLFPDCNPIRMDFDTTRGRNAHEKILKEFESGRSGVLIGTQMIAKGLDIPNVTLVGVIAADSSLFIPDYRSGERTFQLLTQVAGRAGRAGKSGKVVAQTYVPEHPIIEFAAHHDYERFFDYEMQVRKSALFPPFSVFVRVVFTGEDDVALYDQSKRFADGIEAKIYDMMDKYGIDRRALLYIGAAPSPIKRRQGMLRYQVLIKLARTPHYGAIIQGIYGYYDEHRTQNMGNVEINPGDML